MVTAEQVDKAVKKLIKPTNFDVSVQTTDVQVVIRSRVTFLGDSNAEVGYTEIEFYEDRMVWMSLFLDPVAQNRGIYVYLSDVGPKLARELGYDKVQIPITDSTPDKVVKNYTDAGYEEVREGMLETEIGEKTSGPEEYAERKNN